MVVRYHFEFNLKLKPEWHFHHDWKWLSANKVMSIVGKTWAQEWSNKIVSVLWHDAKTGANERDLLQKCNGWSMCFWNYRSKQDHCALSDNNYSMFAVPIHLANLILCQLCKRKIVHSPNETWRQFRVFGRVDTNELWIHIKWASMQRQCQNECHKTYRSFGQLPAFATIHCA